MTQLIYNPAKPGERMTIVCFVSGSGTNYREIVAKNPDHNYIVFTNRPDCGGAAIARKNKHEVIALSHIPYLREARKKYGAGNVPRNCPERIAYEQDLCKLVEESIGGKPDLICLAGFDQWNTDWIVDRYYPKMINVHPGDTCKSYIGLHWIPTAMAILAGEESIRSTLFFVDKGEDNGPVLVQSAPLGIIETLEELEEAGEAGLLEGLRKVKEFAAIRSMTDYDVFKGKADAETQAIMEKICRSLQDALKVKGDWQIYPFAIHELIARGRVRLDGKDVYIDGLKMPVYGYRLDEHEK